jgi:hypothetical protein
LFVFVRILFESFVFQSIQNETKKIKKQKTIEKDKTYRTTNNKYIQTWSYDKNEQRTQQQINKSNWMLGSSFIRNEFHDNNWIKQETRKNSTQTSTPN